jgi:predicted MFS family arabinose efflux permease
MNQTYPCEKSVETMKKQRDPNSYITLTAMSLINSCGAASLLLAPVMVGGLVTTLDFSSQQAGYIISAELAGLGLAAIPSTLWMKRFNWQHVLYAMLSILLAANFLTSNLSDYSSFLMVRFLAGFAAGLALAVSMSVINLTRDPDRCLGYWFSLQLLLTVVGLALLPGFISKFGIGVVYALLGSFQFFLLFGVRLVPSSGPSEQAATIASGKSILVLAVLGFTSIFLFELAVMGLWTYYERIGDAGGLPAQKIANALSIGAFVGFLGSLTAAALTTRFGRLIPIAFGMGLGIFSILILRTEFSVIMFVVSASAFNFAWYFLLPYLMAAIANIDESGRLLIFVNFITGVGLTIGPALAAKLQTEDSYEPVIWMGVITLVLSFLLMIRLAVQPIRAST